MPPYTWQVKGAKYSVSDFEAEHFWQWTDFQSFIECTVCFVAVGSFIMYLLLKYDPFVETVGFLAVFTEAMLGTPQFYRNFTNKSTYGMRFANWLIILCTPRFLRKKRSATSKLPDNEVKKFQRVCLLFMVLFHTRYRLKNNMKNLGR